MNDEKIKELLIKKAQLLRSRDLKEFRKLEDIFHQRTSGRYLSDIILGANDGIITTFVVVAGATGASLSPLVILVLGFANLLGDGLSMGFGNYLGQKSERDYQRGQRQKEEWEIEKLPQIEKLEVEELFKRWGFSGRDLSRAVEIVTSNKEVWVEVMMHEELGIIERGSTQPAKSGLATFLAFVAAGILPLLPFVFSLTVRTAGVLSLIMAGSTLFFVGAMRSRITPQRWLRGGMEMLFVGGLAGTSAFLVGDVIERIVKSYF